MRDQDWVYLGQLAAALRLEKVDGRRIGEMVAEVEQHLVESGVDPVGEFGPPPVLATGLAARTDVRRPGWVPPGWLGLIGGVLLLLLITPLLAPYLWDDSMVRVDYYVIYFLAGGYLGSQWFGYLNYRRLDGRSWRAVTGWHTGLFAVAYAASTVVVIEEWQDDFFLWPKGAYFLTLAVLAPIAIFILIKRHNPIRFPDHAQHLRRLKRGPFAGRPPLSRVEVRSS